MGHALRGRLAAVAVIVAAMGLTAVALGSFGGGDEPVVETTTSTSTTSTTEVEPTTTVAPDDPEPTESATGLQGRYTVEVVAQLPGDATAYVQGLELTPDGRLLRSDGRYGDSDRNLVDPVTGEVLASVTLGQELFAEGLTVVDDEVFQLTWREGVVEVADLDTLETTRTMSYDGEGWGLCWNGEALVMSDGSERLTLRDPVDFAVLDTVEVRDAAGEPVASLNELECVGDQVLANRYGSDEIVVIDPSSGAVDAVIDAASIRPAGVPPADANPYDYVLNGIAFDASDGTLLLTGKWWPATYRVQLVPA